MGVWLAVGYVLGSIPFGLLLTWAAGAGDLRAIGSGSIGATNVLRTGRKGLAAATVLLDGGKGAIAVLLARRYGGEGAAMVAGAAALVGHCYPMWLRFQGGKGIATMLAVTLAAWWPAGVAAALTWLAAARLTRISSVSGLAAAVIAPVALFAWEERGWALTLAMLAALIVWRHRANIARLRNGTEPRIGATTPPRA